MVLPLTLPKRYFQVLSDYFYGPLRKKNPNLESFSRGLLQMTRWPPTLLWILKNRSLSRLACLVEIPSASTSWRHMASCQTSSKILWHYGMVGLGNEPYSSAYQRNQERTDIPSSSKEYSSPFSTVLWRMTCRTFWIMLEMLEMCFFFRKHEWLFSWSDRVLSIWKNDQMMLRQTRKGI